MRKKGYIAILAVLVLLTVTGGAAATLILLSTGSNQAAEALRSGEHALFFSESCLEESLRQIILDPNYTGGNFQIPEGECETNVENNGGNYTIHALGKGAQYKRGVVAEALLGAEKMEITSWKEE